MSTKIPGQCALHAVITPACREGRGDHGAIAEALARIRREMVATLPNWPIDSGAQFHLVFTVERKKVNP